MCARCMHVFATFGPDLHAQSVLSNKISASELSRKFVKSTLLVGLQHYTYIRLVCGRCHHRYQSCTVPSSPPPPPPPPPAPMEHAPRNRVTHFSTLFLPLSYVCVSAGWLRLQETDGSREKKKKFFLYFLGRGQRCQAGCSIAIIVTTFRLYKIC